MLDQYVYKNNKKMRMGYTTGSCAAAASKAAAWMLLHGQILPEVELMTPKASASIWRCWIRSFPKGRSPARSGKTQEMIRM